MKTNTLITVLLVGMVALIAGCETPKDLKSGMVGTYKGFIFNEDEEYPSVTSFKLDGDKLSGKYELDVGHTVTGDLSEFVITGDRTVKCTWIDHASRQGHLNMTFSSDLSSFEGIWNDEGLDGGSAWTGKKQPPSGKGAR